MKRSNGVVDGQAEKRRQAKQSLSQTQISNLNSVAQIRQALQKLLDYLDLPYQP
jgi:hypothetical protein